MSFPPCFLDLRAARKYDAAVFIHGQASLYTQTWTEGAQKGFKSQKGISCIYLEIYYEQDLHSKCSWGEEPFLVEDGARKSVPPLPSQTK